jgi:hypothetical protein
MAATDTPPTGGEPGRTGWAKPAPRLRVPAASDGSLARNVDGRQVAGALQGFGPMWQKTYRIRLSGAPVSPAEVIQVWKENFPTFWPAGNRFYAPLMGLAPGEVALLNLSAPGGRMTILSTGVMVIYADDESFTFMTPEGHIFAGWLTFSAGVEDGCTYVQAQALIRASDPLYELVFRLGGSRQEDRHWEATLRSLAAHFGVDAPVQIHALCVDPRLQWSQARNIWQNAGVRTALYRAGLPVRWIRGRLSSRVRPRPGSPGAGGAGG